MYLYRVLIALVLLAGIAVYLDNNPNGRDPLTFATNHWLGYEPLYVAKDIGIVDESQLKIFTLTSTTEVFRALSHGAVDGAALTMDEALILANEGLSLRIVGVADISNGADAVLLSNRHAPDATLEGMRIGYEGNVLGAYMVARMLEKKGLSLLDVALIEAAPHEHAELLAEGSVDAVVTYEPFVTRLKNDTHTIFTSKDIPGEIVDVLVVPEQYHKPAHISHLLDVWQQGVDNILADNQQVLSDVARRHQLPLEDVRLALNDIAFPNTGSEHQLAMFVDSEQLTRTARRVWQVMQHVGLGPKMSRMPVVNIDLEGGQ